MNKLYNVKVFDKDKEYYNSELYYSFDIAENDFKEKIKTFKAIIEKEANVVLYQYTQAPSELKKFSHISLKGEGYFIEELEKEKIKNIPKFDYYRDLIMCAVGNVFYEDYEKQEFFPNELDRICDIVKEIKEMEKTIKV